MLAMLLRDAVYEAAQLVEPPSLVVVIVVFRHVYTHFFPLLTPFSTWMAQLICWEFDYVTEL